ncbi:Hypothetical_protein [Hexamita inflata]|uniref:Hypothetical_protein n=1 Tax=Hexamita inflata TaxID=28002 RepID=A0AA86NR59_9EUKA|nr:Hypothetical protein HINF_LOCUS10955 [Hexamita inflata]
MFVLKSATTGRLWAEQVTTIKLDPSCSYVCLRFLRGSECNILVGHKTGQQKRETVFNQIDHSIINESAETDGEKTLTRTRTSLTRKLTRRSWSTSRRGLWSRCE